MFQYLGSFAVTNFDQTIISEVIKSHIKLKVRLYFKIEYKQFHLKLQTYFTGASNRKQLKSF